MKTLKTLFAAIIFVGFATAVSAQTDSDAIEAKAEILIPITITPEGVINFGGISSDIDVNPTLDPTEENPGNGNTGLGDTSGDVGIGVFRIGGANQAEINITLPGDATLSNGSYELNFRPSFAWSQNDSDQFGEESFTSENTVRTLSTSGDGSLFVGGEITNLGDQGSGTYSNNEDIKITVEYN